MPIAPRPLVWLALLLVTGIGSHTAFAEPAPPLLLAQSAMPSFNPMQPRTSTTERPQRQAPEGNPELGGLPDAPGAETTYYLCTACHSIRIVTQQRLTDARWDYLWRWMQEEQGMPSQDEQTKRTVLGYLKEHFSAER
ncbi:hypothetical protein [Afifella pfennigii]|uniref:hypothetical protein n=1 Tax=Afifella pfennigii TaxID=209897 RepID=UPI00047D51B8|nr:hypothetical protein [Afifella pfennigii]